MEFAAISSALTLSVFLRKYLRKTYFYNGSVLDGVIMPPFQTEERHNKVCDALTSQDNEGALDDETDVWIATYPKCGTTWMQQIVMELTRLKSEGDEPLNYKDSPWPEAMLFSTREEPGYKGRTMEEFASCKREVSSVGKTFRFIKTHAQIQHLPGIWNRDLKSKRFIGRAIVVTRNPKDACVSMFYHASRIPAFKYNGPFEDWIEKYYEGNVESGSFWDWHAGWRKEYEDNVDKKILWIHFEDMKANPRQEIERVGRFLGLDKSKDFASAIDRALAGSTFKKMKNQYKSGHFRKGKSGGWRSYFTQAQSEAFNARHEEKLKEFPTLLKKYKF